MKSVSLASERHLSTSQRPGVLDNFARQMVLKQLGRLETGSLQLVEGGIDITFGESKTEAGLCAKIEVVDSSFYSDIAFGGSVGAGEAYMRGAWQCEDLVSLVRILLRNRGPHGRSVPARFALAAMHERQRLRHEAVRAAVDRDVHTLTHRDITGLNGDAIRHAVLRVMPRRQQ